MDGLPCLPVPALFFRLLHVDAYVFCEFSDPWGGTVGQGQGLACAERKQLKVPLLLASMWPLQLHTFLGFSFGTCRLTFIQPVCPTQCSQWGCRRHAESSHTACKVFLCISPISQMRKVSHREKGLPSLSWHWQSHNFNPKQSQAPCPKTSLMGAFASMWVSHKEGHSQVRVSGHSEVLLLVKGASAQGG